MCLCCQLHETIWHGVQLPMVEAVLSRLLAWSCQDAPRCHASCLQVNMGLVGLAPTPPCCYVQQVLCLSYMPGGYRVDVVDRCCVVS
jgi:hypothetical protein